MRMTVGRMLQVGLVLAGGCSADTEESPRTALQPIMSGPVFASGPQVVPQQDPLSQPGAQPMQQMPPAGQMPPGQQPIAGGGGQQPEAMMPDPVMPDPVMPDPVMPDPVMPDPVMPTPTNPGDAVPMGDHCAAVADWDPMWVQFEEEVLLLTNEARAVGHNCDTMGEFGPAEPLAMNAELRCSARLHSMDMGMQGYFAHNSQDGTDPFERMAAAGYAGRVGGENIAKGQQSPQEVVNGWLDSDGHCANMMRAGYAELGVGYWEGEAENRFFNGNKLWTQNFGSTGGGFGNWGR